MTEENNLNFQEIYDFLDKCVEVWGNKMTTTSPHTERFEWLVDMILAATIIKAKLQLYEEKTLNLKDFEEAERQINI